MGTVKVAVEVKVEATNINQLDSVTTSIKSIIRRELEKQGYPVIGIEDAG